MKLSKRLFFLLPIIAGMACKYAAAQAPRDTVFSFYFNTNQHTITAKQQMELATFLKKVQRIQSIQGYTDTVGSTEHNKTLSLLRAQRIFNQLPKSLQSGVEVAGNGETKKGNQLWQNRRAEITAILPTTEHIKATDSNFVSDSAKVTELNIEQLLFIPDQPELTEASRQYMQTLARQLLQYEGASFQIIGHVNYQSNLPPERLTDLYQLSEQRAKTVYDLLVQYGIEPRRMQYKGVGNAQPIIANPANEEEKRKNMRVQVLVIRQ